MADIQMPQLGETVTEGTITKWFKQVGEQVAEDEPLFEVSTDKVDSEVPSPVSGTLSEIWSRRGCTATWARLARVRRRPAGDGDGATRHRPHSRGRYRRAGAPAAEVETEPEATACEDPATARGHRGEDTDGEHRRGTAAEGRPSPARRATAAGSLGGPYTRRARLPRAEVPRTRTACCLSRSSVGSSPRTNTTRRHRRHGPGGRITATRLSGSTRVRGRRLAGPAAARSVRPAPALRPRRLLGTGPQPVARGRARQAVPAHHIRRRKAEHMIRSKQTSAHVYASIEVDFEAVEQVRRAERAAFKAAEGFSLTYLPFISRAVVDAIREYPEVNASFGESELVVHNYVNLGIAVDLDFKGLMVPVIHDADGKRLRALARETGDLAERARSKKLGPDDIAGGTFTITNPGPFGTTMTLPVINQPQVAIVSTDAVKRRPVVVDLPDGSEAIAIHSVGNITLTWDHRAFDGAYAAAFLRQIKVVLETRDWAAELA